MNRHMQEQEQEHERRVSVLLEMIQERGGQLSISLRKGSSPRPKALRRRKWTLLKELVQPLRGGKACGRKLLRTIVAEGTGEGNREGKLGLAKILQR